MAQQTEFIANAFVSCSLRNEDEPFIGFIEKILLAHKIKPIGTVGKYSAAPTNPAELMKQNIPKADIIVIAAIPRYLQKDVNTGEMSYGVSEKPVIVFVQEGTHVGNFLPNVTQYIVLNGNQFDLESKWTIINSLLSNAYQIVRRLKDESANKGLWNALVGGLALVGGYALLNQVINSEEEENKPVRKRIQSITKKSNGKRKKVIG
jgi:hypothetical protein